MSRSYRRRCARRMSAGCRNDKGKIPVRTKITLTRRSLLRTAPAATAATLVGVRPLTAARAAAAAGHLRRSSYPGLTGQSFRIGSVDVELLSVSDLAGVASQPALAGSEDAFALAFSGPLDSGLGEASRRSAIPSSGRSTSSCRRSNARMPTVATRP